MGSFLPMLLLLGSGGALLYVLYRLWRLHDPAASGSSEGGAKVGEAARLAGLDAEADVGVTDPWAEALRRRAAGDRAGALIWLFLDQLLALERAGLIRFTAGRTARHYVATVGVAVLRESLRPTLAAFEEVSYGHRVPDSATLDALWSQAETFREALKAHRERK
jgi:hypothetical protein